MRRRNYLVTVGSALTVGVAGCLGGDGEGEPVDEDPNDVLNAARTSFRDVEYVTTFDEIVGDMFIESERLGQDLEFLSIIETTTDHDLGEEAFAMVGDVHLEVDDQEESATFESYYVDGVLYMHNDLAGWQIEEGVEFGLAGDISIDALTEGDILIGEDIVELDGDYVIEASIAEGRKADFFTQGVQEDPFDDVTFEEFIEHAEVDELRVAVDPETDRFSWFEVDTTITLDEDDLGDLGGDELADISLLEMEFGSYIEVERYDDPVDIELPPQVPQV